MTNKKLFAALGLIAKDLRGGDLTVCSLSTASPSLVCASTPGAT